MLSGLFEREVARTRQQACRTTACRPPPEPQTWTSEKEKSSAEALARRIIGSSGARVRSGEAEKPSRWRLRVGTPEAQTSGSAVTSKKSW